MQKFKARDLLNMDLTQIWSLPDTEIKLVFDDGEIITTGRQTIFSRYIWEFHREFPHTPLLKSHHIGDERLSGDTHLTLLGRVHKDSYRSSPIPVDHDDMHRRSREAYRITNLIYNDFQLKCEAWVSGISFIDALEAIHHPEIAKVNANVMPNESPGENTIDNAYRVIKKVLMDPKELPGNGFARAARSKMVSMGQILQCLGPRGYTTDIDSRIFRKPILRGFIHGIVNLEDSLKESRSASKALYFSKDQMAASEYTNRNLQLSAATLTNLHLVDCGTTSTTAYHVSPGDLGDLAGKYYMDEKTKAWVPIEGNEKSLIGKTLALRTIFDCVHPDRYGVCVRCAGDVALAYPKDTGIGHHSASALFGPLGQRILSTKHEDGSATFETIIFDVLEKKFVHTGTNSSSVYLNPKLSGLNLKITISAKEAPNLPDIAFVDDVSIMVPGRYSELHRVVFRLEHKGQVETTLVNTCIGTRYGFCSTDMLAYIKQQSWVFDESGNYVVDMSKWDVNKPLFHIPKKHYSAVHHMKAIEAMVKGRGTPEVPSIVDYDRPEEALIHLHDLVAAKMSISITHLEILILTAMVEDRENRNYHLPLDRKNAKTTAFLDTMKMRSLAPVMAFQGQVPTMYSPTSFVLKDRPRHPLDALLMG